VGIENFSIATTLTHVALPLGTQIPKIHNYAKSHHGGIGDTRVPAHIPYTELLGVALNEKQMGGNGYALFELKDRFNTGCLVKGEGYVPGKQGVVICLNGGDDLSTVLARVAKAGGKVLLDKMFLSKEAGHIAYFLDTEGNKIGLHSMAGARATERP
jgi:uncharacterized protein